MTYGRWDAQMAQALGENLLWNTMVIVAKVKTLWSLGGKVLPSMMRLFEGVRCWMDFMDICRFKVSPLTCWNRSRTKWLSLRSMVWDGAVVAGWNGLSRVCATSGRSLCFRLNWWGLHKDRRYRTMAQVS